MDDNGEKTIFIKNIPGDVNAEQFLSFVEKGSKIKIHEITARRMAEMHIDEEDGQLEGIVTFEGDISKAAMKLRDETINGTVITILESSDLDEILPRHKSVHYNNAWNHWNEKISHHCFSKGNRHGKGERDGKGRAETFYNCDEDRQPGRNSSRGIGGQSGKSGHGVKDEISMTVGYRGKDGQP